MTPHLNIFDDSFTMGIELEVTTQYSQFSAAVLIGDIKYPWHVGVLNCWKSIWLGCDIYTERVVSNELLQRGNIELSEDSAEIQGADK
jgi:hypothetical protein